MNTCFHANRLCDGRGDLQLNSFRINCEGSRLWLDALRRWRNSLVEGEKLVYFLTVYGEEVEYFEVDNILRKSDLVKGQMKVENRKGVIRCVRIGERRMKVFASEGVNYLIRCWRESVASIADKIQLVRFERELTKLVPALPRAHELHEVFSTTKRVTLAAEISIYAIKWTSHHLSFLIWQVFQNHQNYI